MVIDQRIFARRFSGAVFGLCVTAAAALGFVAECRADGRSSVPTVYFGFSTTSIERPGEASGALHVDRVTPGRPADRAGVRPGDLIVAFDGRPFRFETDAQAFRGLAWVQPGKPLKLTVDRDGTTIELVMTPEPASAEQIARNRLWLKEAEAQGGRACLQEVDNATACFFEIDRRVAAAGDRAVIHIQRLPGAPARFTTTSDEIEIPSEFRWRELWPGHARNIDALDPGEIYSLEIVREGDRTRVAPLNRKRRSGAAPR